MLIPSLAVILDHPACARCHSGSPGFRTLSFWGVPIHCIGTTKNPSLDLKLRMEGFFSRNQRSRAIPRLRGQNDKRRAYPPFDSAQGQW